jgi:hypothetical protein
MYRYPIITITHPNGNITQINTNSPAIQNLFNENYFRANLARSDLEILNQGIANNVYLDTYDFWARVGIKAGLSASPYYNEAAYLTYNPDIAALVKGQSINPDSTMLIYDSGQQHWLHQGRIDIINGLRSTAAYPASFLFTITDGVFIAYPYVGGVFTGTDLTVRVGDIADGGTASLSTMILTLNGGNSGAAKITNIGTINCIVASASGGGVDATNFYDVTTIRSINSIGTLTIGNLNLNPSLIIDYSSNLTVNYMDMILSGNNKTVDITITAISSANIILNNTSSGYFSTIAITCVGAIADIITSLSGTALVGASTLSIKGTQSLTMTLHSSISTIRTIAAAPKTAITFSDSITGTNGNILTATFNTAGSVIKFIGTQTLAATNVLTFTGTGNTLSITPIMVSAINSNIGASYTNLNILDIDGQLASGTTIVATNYGASINKVNLNGLSSASAPIRGPSIIRDLPTGSTVNIGMSTTAITSLVGALTINGTGSVELNILGTTPTVAVADTLNITGFTTATLNISTIAIPAGGNTLGFTLPSTSSITSLTVTGGNASSIVAVSFNTLPATITTFNASACLSPITATASSTLGVNIAGSFVSTNTLTGSTGNDIIIGGVLPDTIDAKAGTNTVTGHGNLGSAATDINSFVVTSVTGAATYTGGTEVGVTTITDFNPGTNSTAIDIVRFSISGINVASTTTPVTGLVLGNGSAAVVGSATIASWNLAIGATGTIFTLTSSTNLIQYTGALTTPATLAQINALFVNNDFRLSANFTGATTSTKGIPFLYLNSTDSWLHLAIVNFTMTNGSNLISGENVSDIMVFAGINSFALINSTDFAFIA